MMATNHHHQRLRNQMMATFVMASDVMVEIRHVSEEIPEELDL